MAKPSEKDQRAFKDYYYILQIHPEADYAMVDAAYWHLARRYNQAALADPSARARLDDLNEAYSILGSPSRREDYGRVRNAVLGAGAMPAPAHAAAPPPLAIMERQRPRPRERPAAAARAPSRGWASVSPWQLVAAAAVMVTLGAAAFGSWAPPTFVGGLLGAGILAVSLQPLWRLLGIGRRVRLPTPKIPKLRRQTRRAASASAFAELRDSTVALRDRTRGDPDPLGTPQAPMLLPRDGPFGPPAD